MARRITSTQIVDYLIALVIVLVPFYAFLTVFGSTLIGHYTILRLWDSLILAVVLVCAIVWLIREKALREHVFSSVIVRLICAYALLVLLLGFVALLKHEVTLKALAYSADVNLRFLCWFLVVYVAALRSTFLHRHWQSFVFWPALIVCVFALIQFFVLSPKFLAHFGYDSLKTVAPVTTINQASSTVRVQSFLRGPNPLGAYMVLTLGVLLAFSKRYGRRVYKLALSTLVILTLGLTFSRSAWIGAVVVGLLALFLNLRSSRARLKAAVAILAILLFGVGTIIAFSHNTGVQDAFLHVSPESSIKDTSNKGHDEALRSGISDVVHEPFGRGPGTAGPPSLYNSGHAPRNSENYFLEIGQETGWAGLLIFCSINVLVGLALWRRRSDKMVFYMFVTLVGLAIVNQLSYAWSDDTLAFVWWGLAGISIARNRRIEELG